MPSFAIEPPPVVTLPIAGSDAVFPVRRVYCIGRNYAAHTIEMGGDPNREAPFFFQKNPDNLDTSGEFPYPPGSSDVHHEAEVAVMLKSGGVDIPVDRALEHVYGYALALDMTRRDLQGEQKKLRRPWENRQGVRAFGAGRAGAPGIGDRASVRRPDRADGQWRAPPGRRSQPHDLEGAGDDLVPLGVLRARRRRCHPVGNPLGRGRGRERR